MAAILPKTSSNIRYSSGRLTEVWMSGLSRMAPRIAVCVGRTWKVKVGSVGCNIHSTGQLLPYPSNVGLVFRQPRAYPGQHLSRIPLVLARREFLYEGSQCERVLEELESNRILTEMD